jgi:translation initiation factor IF-3
VPFVPRAGGGVSAPYNPRPAGASAPYNPRPAGVSAPYNPRPVGASAAYNPRPAGVSAPYNPRPAGASAPYNPRPTQSSTGSDAPRVEYDRSAYDRHADRNGSDKGPQLLNSKVRATEFRLIEEGGINRIVSRAEAEALSAETGMDLLIISLESSPPVIRLVDYGKFKYETEKKSREARKKQHTTTVKEIKMSVRIDDNDYQVKVRRAISFLEDGDKVKMTLRLKGREIQHSNLALELANQFVLDLEEHGLLDGRVRQEGRTFTVLFSPKPQAAKKPAAPSSGKTTATSASDKKPIKAKPAAEKQPTSPSDEQATSAVQDPASSLLPVPMENAQKDDTPHAEDEDA